MEVQLCKRPAAVYGMIGVATFDGQSGRRMASWNTTPEFSAQDHENSKQSHDEPYFESCEVPAPATPQDFNMDTIPAL